MTKEEEQEFRDKVAQTIFPLALNMTEDQIRQIIISVDKNNPNLPFSIKYDRRSNKTNYHIC